MTCYVMFLVVDVSNTKEPTYKEIGTVVVAKLIEVYKNKMLWESKRTRENKIWQQTVSEIPRLYLTPHLDYVWQRWQQHICLRYKNLTQRFWVLLHLLQVSISIHWWEYVLANKSPGNRSHVRWLTRANGIFRVYVSVETLPVNLVTRATNIITVCAQL